MLLYSLFTIHYSLFTRKGPSQERQAFSYLYYRYAAIFSRSSESWVAPPPIIVLHFKHVKICFWKLFGGKSRQILSNCQIFQPFFFILSKNHWFAVCLWIIYANSAIFLIYNLLSDILHSFHYTGRSIHYVRKTGGFFCLLTLDSSWFQKICLILHHEQ